MKKIFVSFLIFCVAAVSVMAQTASPDFIDGRIYFKFNDDQPIKFKVAENNGVALSEFPFLETLADEFGIVYASRPLYLFNDPKLLRTIEVAFTEIDKADELVKRLSRYDFLEYAEKIPLKKLFWTPNDTYYSQQGSYNAAYRWHLDKINASAAWDLQQGSPSVKVAIVDNAVWGAHPDLNISSSNLCKVVASGWSYSYSTGNADPSGTQGATETAYEWSHGTHCAGLVGAINNNNEGIASIGGGVTLMGIRIADNNGNMYLANEGVQWAADNGAKVISMSYGSTQSSNTEQNLMQTCYNNGIILVAAAGNEGDYGNEKNYPAAYSSVIGVAAINSNGKLVEFSQYGSGRADIAAPGGFYIYNGQEALNIISTTWCKAYMLGGTNGFLNSNVYYDGMQGTSMACPITAGLCGLLASACPDITPAQAKNCLQTTATALASGSNQIDGNGYINAQLAVQCAKNLGCSGGTDPVDPGTPVDPINPGTCDYVSRSVATNTCYQSQDGGYVAGSNGYGDKAKAEYFTNNGTISINKIKIQICGKDGNGGSIKFKVWSVSNNLPGTELASSAAIALSSLPTSGDYEYTFSTPVSVTGNYFVGIDVSGATSYIGLTSSEENAGANTAYDMGSSGTWLPFTHQNAWRGSYTMAIFPCVSSSGGTTDPQPGTCDAPTNLSATANNNTHQIRLQWNAVANATSYKVFRNGQFKATATTNSWTDATAANNTNYTYYVQAVCANGTSGNSNTVSAKLNYTTTAIEDYTNSSNDISIFPNPAKEVLNVIATEDFQNVEIVNFLGQTIYRNALVNNELQINVANFAAGVYFIRLNGKVVVTKKFVKE